MALVCLLAFILVLVTVFVGLGVRQARADTQPAAAPQFTRHPADSTYAQTASARFYVRAASTDGGYLTYQWYRSEGYDEPLGTGGVLSDDEQQAIKESSVAIDAEDSGTFSVLTTTTPTVEDTTWYYYWVTVVNHKDLSGDGDTDDPGEAVPHDSALALTKVVARTLPDHITNGDFSTLYAPNGQNTIYWSNGGQNVNGWYTIAAQSRLPNWKTTDYNASGANIANFGDTRQSFQVFALNLKPFGYSAESDADAVAEPENPTRVPASPSTGIRPGGQSAAMQTTVKHGDNGGDTGNFGAIELANANTSSVYQEVATVPGKIYEWSLDHIRRADTGNNDVMAVVIGSAINEPSELGIDSNLPQTYPASAANGSSELHYPYGINSSTYFYKIVQALATRLGVGSINNLTNYGGQSFTQEYNGHTYYIYIASTGSSWKTYSGSYTVPAGQGTTVFGFVGIYPVGATGNVLDNIFFASGTDLSPTQDVTYTGETSIVTPTKAGFAYALAEVRGSSINELTGLSAWYDPDAVDSGAAEVAVEPSATLGAGGWYTSYGAETGTAFAAGGALTFKDLVPGKTYRVVGIPQGAVNTGLHTNESPGNVLDDGYYRDVKIQAAYAGAPYVLPSYDVEIYDADKARITLKNTNSSVQYALLAGDSAAPVTSGPALPSTAWKSGAGGTTVFEELALGTDYWLVSRPANYTEVNYAVAAYSDDGALAALRIVTPVVDAVDLAAADVTRAMGGTGIVIRAAGTRAGYNYALADPANGEIVSGPFAYTGAAVTFSSLDPAAVYQVVSRVGEGTWLKGVRVYPYPSAFAVDYGAEVVRSNAVSAGAAGFIPADTEYRVRASGGAALWLVGDNAVWRRGTGTECLELTQAGVAVGEASVFDALDDAGASVATVFYRLAITDGYVGQSVQPELSLAAPARPTAPLAGAGVWSVDYINERLVAGGAALQWRTEASSSYTALAAGDFADFAALGWSAAVGQRVVLRYPQGAAVFASRDSEPATLPGRPAAPEGLTAALVEPDDPSAGITVGNLEPGRAYQYSRGVDTGENRLWTDFIPDASSVNLFYDGEGGDYGLRYPATDEAPASFYATAVPSPLNASALNLGSATFGAMNAAPHALTINNIASESITLFADQVSLSGAGSHYFVLNNPGAVIVPAATGGAVGQSQAWTVTPVAGIPAGSYTIQVNIAYSHDEHAYTCRSNGYFTVNKANWNLSGLAAETLGLTSSGFGLAVTGAPEGVQLSYQLGGDAFSAWDGAVGADGVTHHHFSGLAAASSYAVRVRAAGDDDHNESAAVVLLTAYTAQATPDASAVVRANYADETLVFASGCNPADYAVTVADSGAELGNLASLTSLADAGDFNLSVVRKAAGPYPASAPAFLSVARRAAAPAGTAVTPASDDNTADGAVSLAGTFQYRASRNGADVTSGWTSVAGSVSVTAGRYEVRRAPTASTFASAIAQVRVLSLKPSVTLHVKTYAIADGGETVSPSYLTLPAGWALSTDPERAGQYDHSYLISPLALPAVGAVTSRSHVFKGWYENAALTGPTVTMTPNDEILEHRDYWAKWVVRPTVATVASVVPAADVSTAAQGLAANTPAKLSAALPAGKSTLALGDLVVVGQSGEGGAAAAVLYSDPGFVSVVSDSLPLAWADEANYPTRAWLGTVSADDDATAVYYELALYTTRRVNVAAVTQTGGASGVRTSTGISLTFDAPVAGLTADAVSVADGTGRAVKGALSGAGAFYTLDVSGVTEGAVNVTLADWVGYDVDNAPHEVDIYKDTAPPTGSIIIQGHAFTQFLDTDTFGLFFKQTVDVTMTAADTDGDGLVKIEYLKAASPFASAGAAQAASGWQTYTAPVAVLPGEKFFVYARLTDASGNVAVLRSDGTVVYMDSAADTDKVNYTKLSSESKTVSVVRNGNVIDAVTLPGPAFTPLPEGAYTVSEGGAGSTIALAGSYLETLSAGAAGIDSFTHNFVVHYRPLGVAYVDDAGVGTANQAPATTAFDVEVLKAVPALALSVPPAQAGGATYGENNVTLRVDVESGGAVPTGAVNFYDGVVDAAHLLGGGPINVEPHSTGGRASVTVTLSAGVHTLLAAYSGDDNYAAAAPQRLVDYTVAQASQGALMVKEGGAAVTALSKAREDVSFTLTVEGGFALGSGAGANSYVWTSSAPTAVGVAPVADSGGAAATVTLLTAGSATLTVTRAGDANHLAATPAEVALSVAEETTKPVPGGAADDTPDSTLAAANLSETGLTLSWSKATDAFPAGRDAALRYFVYLSVSTTNNISTPEDCAVSGTLLNTGGSADIAAYAVSGLAADTPYWFNVVVKDEAGNAAAYASRRVVTPLAVALVSAAQYGGKNGRVASTGVWLVFDRAVTGFDAAHVDVTVGGASSTQRGAISAGGDSDAATWLVTFAPFTGANGTQASIAVSGWTNAASGHSYFFAGGSGSGSDPEGSSAASMAFALYAPVAWPMPAASIDYIGERLTGLAPGGTYVFANESHGYGGENAVDVDGVYDRIPFSELGVTLRIVRKGVSAGVTLGDDDLGAVDSPAQALVVPARPVAPSGFAVEQPASMTPTGMLSNVNAAMEYRAASEDAWTPIGGESVSGLVPGTYYLRVKAVADEKFASAEAVFYVHAYNAIRFDDALQGYAVGGEPGQAAPQTVIGDDTIANVTFVSGAADAFTLLGTGVDWTIAPKPGLAPETHAAQIELTYENSSTSTQDVSFTVHPKAELVSAAASSSAGADGLTDTLTLAFTYPVTLAWDSVTVGGAAHKRADAQAELGGFVGVNADKTVYTLKLSPQYAYHTGDAVDVAVNLGSAYAFQIAQTGQGVLTAHPPVAIPRALKEARVLPGPDDWTSLILQITFDDTRAVTDPATLEWFGDGDYTGPIVLSGEAAETTAVNGVFRVTEREGWTYRVMLDVSASGALFVGLPTWDVAAVDAGQVVLASKSVGDFAYFLDGEGHNYLTNINAEQVLPAAHARGGYVAPAYGLRTSKEIGVGVADIYLDGAPLDAGLWRVSGGGPAQFIFDGGAPVSLADQLIVTLEADWTRTEGAHTVLAAFDDDSAAQAVVAVEGITPTWPLTLLGSEGAVGFAGGDPGAGGAGMATGAYGPGDGCFAAGSAVVVTAAAAAAGWRFDAWAQTSAGAVVALPQGSPGTITMPAEPLTLTARYTDGAAPVSTLTLGGSGGVADGAWTATGLLTLSAVDDDVRAGGDTNPTGADLGTVASVSYRVDGRPTVTVAGGETDVSLSALGAGWHTVVHWATDAAGNAEVAHTAVVGYDAAPPSGSIRLRGLVFDRFIAAPAFVRFYRGDVAVMLTGGDETDGSGVARVEYLVRDAAFGSEAEAAVAVGWAEADEFSLGADGAYIIYARMTDNAGNVRVIATDGVVRYTDGSLLTAPAPFTKTSEYGVSAVMALHGNTVASVKRGDDVLTPDVAYGVTDETLSFTAAYLNDLPVPEAGSHSFVVQINPQGRPYVADGAVDGTGGGNGSGNDAPAEIIVALSMAKAASALTLSAEPAATVYGNSTLLSATVAPGANGTTATGEMRFFDGETLLGGAVALTAVEGKAVAALTVGLGAGGHELRAEYSGDGNFSEGSSVAVSYDVEKAAQDAVSIVNADGDAVVGPLVVDYGDDAFVLRATGGSGAGVWVWASSNTAVAAVDEASGEVTVVSVGHAVISAQRTSDDNYNVSAVASFVLEVERRPVRIEAVAVKDKVYDGTDFAEFAAVPALVNAAPGDEQAIYVSLAGASAHFVSDGVGDPADVGANKTVQVGGFVLAGAKIASYELVSVPSAAIAAIEKAAPVWDGAGPVVSGGVLGDGTLFYGQRLANLMLDGVARDIRGMPLDGTLTWAPTVDVTQIPGSDAESAAGGLASGYAYDVVFVPADPFVTNYRALADTVTVAVRQAAPEMAGRVDATTPGPAPVGSPIFASDSGRPETETLADSTITGDVVFAYGGVETAVVGMWVWDDDANGTAAADIAYASTDAGIHHPYALFVPEDPRIAPLSVEADVIVYSPRSVVAALPTMGAVAYGGTVGRAAIGDDGRVLAVSADDADPDDYEDITAFGGWHWKSPDTLITSKTGRQTAVLVFTPDGAHLVDFAVSAPTGYLPVERAVELEVAPVTPELASAVTDVPAVILGQALSASDVGTSTYEFGGVANFGDEVLSGHLAWEDSSLVPGAAGHEADGLGGAVRESGLFVARATFTPDDALYGSAYASATVDVRLVVAASAATRQALSDRCDDLRDRVLPAVQAALANYGADAVDAVEDALSDARALLDAGVDSEDAFARALDALNDAADALVHDHPIIRQEPPGTSVDLDEAMLVEAKGDFASVTSVHLDDTALAWAPAADPGGLTLSLPPAAGGTAVGSLFEGADGRSAVAVLLPAFVNTLAKGEHVVVLQFADGYASGFAEVRFTIAYADNVAPSGAIRLRGLVFDAFIAAPAFVRFYRGDVAAELTGADVGGSGVARVEYLVRDRGAAFATEAAAEAAAGWVAADGLTLDVDGAFIVYARITDRAGNVRVISTDGIVRYTDGALAAPPPPFTKTSDTGVSAVLALRGSTVAAVKRGDDWLPSAAYQVAGETLTFNSAYLNSLPAPDAGGYGFHVLLNPQGLAYVEDGGGSGNDAPAPIELTLYVVKAAQVAVNIVDAGGAPMTGALEKIYGDAAFVLGAEGGLGMGAFVWESSDAEVAAVDASTGEVSLRSAGSAVLSVRRTADDNYSASSSASLALHIARRPVRIETVEVADKAYDGTDAAAFAAVPALAGVAPGDENAVGVSLAGAFARFVSVDVGEEPKVVLVGGFALVGAKVDSYELVYVPEQTTATIEQALPVWDGGIAVGGGPFGDGTLVFGQRLSSLTLAGGALGVDGLVLPGTLAWAPSVGAAVPGSDAESAADGLDPAGYACEVVFVPDLAFQQNYRTLEGMVVVTVLPAESAAAGGTAPVGSPIFASDSARPETLLDALPITGDVVFVYDGVETAVLGHWTWDDEKNGGEAAGISYAGIGIQHPFALFTPEDPRIAPLSVPADVIVYSPRSEIGMLPTIGTVGYGGTVGDAWIGDDGRVFAVSADDADPADAEDITAQGTWVWKNPGMRITARNGVQRAVLVFRPNDDVLADLTGENPTGYLPAEAAVSIGVTPAVPVAVSLSDVPGITFGQPLSASDLGAAHCEFSGVAAFGQDVLVGGLMWDEPSLVPGSAGHEADGLDGLVRESGCFVAYATFVPDAALYGDVYTSCPVQVVLSVTASEDTQEALSEARAAGIEVTLPAVISAVENYDAAAVAAFEKALEAAESFLAAGDGSEDACERVLLAVETALAALVHDHPIIRQSPMRPIVSTGTVGVSVEIKGSFETVASVTFDGVALVVAPSTAPDTLVLSMPVPEDAAAVGLLSKGSAVVELFPAFIDSLGNGVYTIGVWFVDEHAGAFQETTFVIERSSGGGSGNGGGSGSGGGNGAGADSGGAGGNDDDDDAGEGDVSDGSDPGDGSGADDSEPGGPDAGDGTGDAGDGPGDATGASGGDSVGSGRSGGPGGGSDVTRGGDGSGDGSVDAGAPDDPADADSGGAGGPASNEDAAGNGDTEANEASDANTDGGGGSGGLNAGTDQDVPDDAVAPAGVSDSPLVTALAIGLPVIVIFLLIISFVRRRARRKKTG
jgi:hypothetical protein